jgi:hypothetical protein
MKYVNYNNYKNLIGLNIESHSSLQYFNKYFLHIARKDIVEKETITKLSDFYYGFYNNLFKRYMK